MKKILYIFYIVIISNYFLPLEKITVMAQDMVQSPYSIASSRNTSCYDIQSYNVGGTNHAENIKTLFYVYDDAATGSICQL